MSTSNAGPGPLTPLPSPPHPNRAGQLPSTPSSLSSKREEQAMEESDAQIDEETQSAGGDVDGEGMVGDGAGDAEGGNADAAMAEIDEQDARPIRKPNIKSKMASRSTRASNSTSVDEWSRAGPSSSRASGRRPGPSASSKGGDKFNFNSEGMKETILNQDYWKPNVDLFMEQEDLMKARALAAAATPSS